MSESTALANVVKQSAFAKQNMSMGDLFAQRLQNIFAENLGSITITEFKTREDYWSGITEGISFTLPNGQKVVCEISTPKEKS